MSPIPDPSTEHVRLAWPADNRLVEAIEPDEDLVERNAERLRDWYNDPDNASMMDGCGTMSTEDVVDFWRTLRNDRGRGFFAFENGVLVGDADLRQVRDGAAEFALMIGPAEAKGRGVGRALAILVHVFAFRELGLPRLFVPPRRDNVRVHALNRFLGYEPDDGQLARAFGDEPSCQTYSLSARAFREKHAAAWCEVEVHR